jgi:rhamnosyltransferase
MPGEVWQLGCVRVQVLLATRNGEAWIERQISSVLAQRGVDVSIQVRDDASTDGTREIVSAIAMRDPRVRLLPDHAGTGSAGANFFRLIFDAEIRGDELVAFCDQDDEWFEDKLSRAAAQLAVSRAGGYSAAVLARWANGREKRLLQHPKQRVADYLFEGAGQGCTFVMTPQLFVAVRRALDVGRNLIGAIHYHDWTVYALARSFGMGWHVDPVPVMTYNQHAENDTGARTSVGGVARRLAQIRVGWYRDQVNAIAAFVRRVNPDDLNAIAWEHLSARTTVAGVASRFGFVIAKGRRRLSDRLIQAIAVICGYL